MIKKVEYNCGYKIDIIWPDIKVGIDNITGVVQPELSIATIMGEANAGHKKAHIGLVCTKPPAPLVPMPLGISGAWKLKFQDEFSGTTLDETKWNKGWFGTGITKPVNNLELAAYDPAQQWVKDGAWHSVVKESSVYVSGKYYPYRTGYITSNGKFSYQYGVCEARIYIPEANGVVVNCPAFWTTGQTWPTNAEIDIIETTGWNYHSPKLNTGSVPSGKYSGWHTFASLWGVDGIAIFWDGKQVGQLVTATAGVTPGPHYILLGNQVGNFGGPNYPGADMVVDYVRVWQL